MCIVCYTGGMVIYQYSYAHFNFIYFIAVSNITVRSLCLSCAQTLLQIHVLQTIFLA